jgi:hypothetical protein
MTLITKNEIVNEPHFMDEISLDGVYYILRLHEFSMDILPFHED